jgi:hypothetical protein
MRGNAWQCVVTLGKTTTTKGKAMPIYVKHGLAGYGPDLDEYDEGSDSYTDAAYVIAEELSRAADSAEELAHSLGDEEQFAEAWQEHVRSEELAVLAANFSPDRANAPLYKDNPELWETTIRELTEATFPVAVSKYGRLYVWEADES